MALKLRYSPLTKPSFENIYHTFTGLSAREQFIATIIAVFVFVSVTIIPLSYISGKIGGLKKNLSRSQFKLDDVLSKVSDYKNLQLEVSRLEKTFDRNISSMTATIEGLVKQTGLEPSIDSLKEKPSMPGERFFEKSAELKLKNASLKDLIDLIYKIENYPLAVLRIRNLQLKPYLSKRTFFDTSMDIVSIELQEGGES